MYEGYDAIIDLMAKLTNKRTFSFANNNDVVIIYVVLTIKIVIMIQTQNHI